LYQLIDTFPTVLLANPGAERKVAQRLDEVAKTIKNRQRTNSVRR
jgi:hypothetical protein